VGDVRVRLSPEVGVDFPVEVFAGHGFGYVNGPMLGISPGLEADLIRWQRWWQDRVGWGDEDDDASVDASGEWTRWHDGGAALRERLEVELGPGFDVAWD
jgi:hypothetical protein